MGLGGSFPLPSDALVTPVTFRIKKRNLRGILSELDSAETGLRELAGEWVVGRKTWQRLQAEWKASQQHLNSQQVKSSAPKCKTERVILYIHGGELSMLLLLPSSLSFAGGAYYLGSAASQRLMSIPLAKYTDARVFGVSVPCISDNYLAHYNQ